MDIDTSFVPHLQEFKLIEEYKSTVSLLLPPKAAQGLTGSDDAGNQAQPEDI